MSNDGLSGRISGYPALPTWLAKRIMGLALTAKGQAETDAANIRSSAGVAVFVSTRDDKAAWVEAGRSYKRFALQATALDVRTAFINQPIEMRSLRPEFESWLNLKGVHFNMIRKQEKNEAFIIPRNLFFLYRPFAPPHLKRSFW